MIAAQPELPGRMLVSPGDADDRVVRRWGGRALGLLARHAPDAASLAAAVAPAGVDGAAVTAVHGELLRRLRSAPASEVWFDLADVPVGDPAGPAAAGVAAARLTGLAVRGEVAPVGLGLRLGGTGAGGTAVGATLGAALGVALEALVATAERGAGAPEVELGALPEGLAVVVAHPGAALGAAATAALERSHDLPPGWLQERAEPSARSAPVLSGAQEADASAVRGVWAEHARLVLEARAAGLEPGADRHPAHLVARHLADLVLAAG